MPDNELELIWQVTLTEARSAAIGIHAASTGVVVQSGSVLAGVDSSGHKHLLIPLRPGEAFSEDLSGRAVQLRKIPHAGRNYLSATCVQPELDRVFAQFAKELLPEVAAADDPVRATIDALQRWRRLFSDAERTGILPEEEVIGLLAELMVLEELLRIGASRDLSVWTGPDGSQHDFRRGARALEVKASLAREGRFAKISSVEQLEPPHGGELHLVHFRLERDPDGDCLPGAVDRILASGVERPAFLAELGKVGYSLAAADLYVDRRYSVVERTVYDASSEAFPRIVPASFVGGRVPPGTLRISYTVDLSNEPPRPLAGPEVSHVFERIASL